MSMVGPYESDPVVKAAIEVAQEFLLEIVTPPARELGELLADRVRSYRLDRQIKTLSKAKDKLRESGISPGKVSLKILVPLLDSCSFEEEESMIDRWANLLTSAINPNVSSNIQIGYIEVLRLLSPKDALVLDNLYDYYNEKLAEGTVRGAEPFQIELDGAKLQTLSGIEQRDFERAMDNLFRLNLLSTSGALLENPQVGEDFYSAPDNIRIQFTRFGYGFVSACRA